MKHDIDMTGVSYTIGDKIITAIQVEKQYFKGLVGMVVAAARGDGDVTKAVEMARLKNGIVKYYAGTDLVEATDISLREMPIPLVRKIRAAMNFDSKPGEITVKGDGITSPVVYKLGEPILTDKGEITELEFLASTLGDIEDVIFRTNSNEQALALLESVATPLGSDLSLQALPAWAVEKITIIDGATIASEIVPLFLD